MKTFTKYASLFLALLMMAGLLASCGETATPADDSTQAAPSAETVAPSAATTAEESTEPVETEPVFPDADYNGESFTVYGRKADDYNYNAMYIYAESETGDVMNDSVLKRNTLLQQKYNIVINFNHTVASPYKTVTADLAAGDVSYDVVLDRRSDLATLVTKGSFYEINQLNIDYSNTWWDSNCINDYKIFGKNYFFVNDVSTGNLGETFFIYWNKQITEDFKLKDPYELMANNEWTLDNFVEMVKSVSDVKADGSLGTYGILNEVAATNGTHMHLIHGCGIKYVSVNADGELTCAVEENIDKIQAISDKIKVCLVDGVSSLSYENTYALCKGYANRVEASRAMFAQGHFLFVQDTAGDSYMYVDMADEYGVLPNPKYDQDQENYYHKVDKFAILWAIPNSASVDKDRFAKVMDYWAYLSSQTVMPSFYDVTVRSKRVSEATAAANLDIIKNSITYELADLYCKDINTCVSNGYFSGSVATAYKQYKNAIIATLKANNKLLAAIE